MHEFKYKGNSLYCETISVADIAGDVGTPFYLYSYKTLLDHYQKIKKAFSSVRPLICFSMKVNSNLAVCKALVNNGAGLDIVSGGELYRALKIGTSPQKIVYAGVGKTPEEISLAIKAGILFFNVESIPELELVNSRCEGLKKKANVCIRINPDVDPKTHKYITTGKAETKFGLDFGTAKELFLRRKSFPRINLTGVHIHIGSQITQARPFVQAIKKTLDFIEKLRSKGIDIGWLNIGGGLGIIYDREKPQTAANFAKTVLPLLKGKGLKLILEPGRFIAGNAGILVTRVLYVKEGFGKRFVIVDAGMNDLLRPSLYGAYHNIQPFKTEKVFTEKKPLADVVGPICESGDFLGKGRRLDSVKQGDLLAVFGAGAYSFTMSSNYNSRRRVPEVMVIKNKWYTVKQRESYRDLVRGETVPEVLR